jgi:hypothetical protein
MADFPVNISSMNCPKCNHPMQYKNTSDIPISSGNSSGTASLSFISASGSTVNQSWYVYFCPNCGFQCKSLDNYLGD